MSNLAGDWLELLSRVINRQTTWVIIIHEDCIMKVHQITRLNYVKFNKEWICVLDVINRTL